MESKITLSQVARLMAPKTGKTAALCEEFLKQLFSKISESLEDGNSVRIKDLGVFKLTAVASRKSVDVTTGESNEIPAHSKIVFVPCKELAAAVNAPFDMFDTVIVEEEMLEDRLAEEEAVGNDMVGGEIEGEEIIEREKASEHVEEVEKEAREELEPVILPPPPVVEDPVADSEPADQRDAAPESVKPEPIKPESVKPESIKPESIKPESVDLDPVEQDETEQPVSFHKSRRSFGSGFFWGFAVGLLALLLCGGAFWWLAKDNLLKGVGEKDSNADVALVADTEDADAAGINAGELGGNVDVSAIADIEEGVAGDKDKAADIAPTKPSDSEPVYDTISHTRFLTSMAKDHYGNMHLWPYIYEENAKILGHPNRIKPGTRVVIPDLAKYGVDPKSREAIEKGKRKAAEIYARYQ